ncbi:MAG: hypothetical protein RLO17_24680 [Cyclobacteriaceae bacterium]
MKKLVTILLSLLILSSSGVMVLAKHYCDGELVNARLIEKPDSCCNGENSGCCNTEQQDLKHDDNTLVSVYSFQKEAPALIGTIEFPSLSETIISNNSILKELLQTPQTVSDILIRIQLFLL